MSADISLVSFHTWGLVILVGLMIVAFITQKLPVDVTAMAVLLVLLVGKYVTPEQAFAGFSSPVVIVMVCTLFVAGALRATGVSDTMARWIHRCAGLNERVAIAVVMIVSGLLSAFMNNVSAAALVMPAVAMLATEAEIPPSRLYIPLAFAVGLGGMLTVIGTPPNIVAVELLRQRGMPQLHFFDFAPYGVVAIVVGTIFMCTLGHRLLPTRKTQRRTKRLTDLRTLYSLQERLFSIRVPDGAAFSGSTLADLRFSAYVGGVVVTIIRAGRKLLSPRAEEKLFERDTLLIRGNPDRFEVLVASKGLEVGEIPPAVLTRLAGESEIVRFRVRDVHTDSQTIPLRGILRHSGIIPLAFDRCTDEPTWETIPPSWFLDTIVHGGDVLVGCIGGRFSEDAPALDMELEVLADATEHLKSCLHTITITPAGWSGAPLHRLAHDSKLAILGRIAPDNSIEWLDVPSVLPSGERGPSHLGTDHVLREGESYLVSGPVAEAKRRQALSVMSFESDSAPPDLESQDVGIVELVLTPRSGLIGRTLADLHFREKYSSQVLALWRDGRPLLSLSSKLPLRYGDALLVQGPRASFPILAKDPDLLLLSEHRQSPKLSIKSLFAIVALLMLMFLPLLTGLPIHEAAFVSACLVVFSRAITMEEAYREIEWRIVFLLALMIPLGHAVEQAEASAAVVSLFRPLAAASHPILVLATLMLAGSLMSQLIDGSLAVLFLGPLALSLAHQTGQSPISMLLAVTLGSSLAFMHPMSSRSNLLVTGAGGYRTGDFLRVGTPFSLVVGIALLAALVLLGP